MLLLGCSAGTTDGGGGNTSSSGAQSGGTFSSSTGFASGGAGGGGLVGDPKTCAEAAMYRTYLGCDFYPTVTANNVWSLFDYAVVVANAGATAADVQVTQGGAVMGSATVPPNGLATCPGFPS